MKRDEYKYPLKESVLDPNRYINGRRFYVEHEPRIVSSIYFDYADLRLYRQSEEGLTPRRKVRFRWYGEALTGNLIDTVLELKTTAPNYREKKSILYQDAKSSHDDDIRMARYQIESGTLNPQTLVQYRRCYFASRDGARVTIDNEIRYGLVNTDYGDNYECRIIVAEPMSVMEVKPLHSQLLEDMPMKNTLTRARFSKYCRSIDQIYFR